MPTELIMAQTDHQPSTRDVEPNDDQRVNPLGRIHWMMSESRGARARAEATLAMHCTGIHALARLLANSEAFRDVQANCQSVEPRPLATQRADQRWPVYRVASTE
jgi:hypothetical protein